MTALHQQWVDAYDRVKNLPDDELVRTIYKTKIRNTLMKARQRRNQDRVRVILVARRGKSIKALTKRDHRVAEALHRRVQEQGYPTHFEVDYTDGVAFISVELRALRVPKKGEPAPEPDPTTDPTAAVPQAQT
jgi:predicted nucleic acid-binding protein